MPVIPTKGESVVKVDEYIPDYTVKVLTDVVYFCITYPTYKAAMHASLIERDISCDGNVSNREAELEKVSLN